MASVRRPGVVAGDAGETLEGRWRDAGGTLEGRWRDARGTLARCGCWGEMCIARNAGQVFGG